MQNNSLPVYIASDHRGFEQKERLVLELQNLGWQIIDLGPHQCDPDDDFNDAAINVARAVKSDASAKGILICGSAHGVTMQANRFKGIRAIAAYDRELASRGREHEDANILCLSADFSDFAQNLDIIKAFFATNFIDEERYRRRNARLDEEEL